MDKDKMMSISIRHALLFWVLLTNTAPGITHAQQPNILLVTVDDMNANSVGVYGCELLNTTPTIDQLAKEGIMFRHAYVQVGNCIPSRNVLLSGRYPHNNGVEGFYQVKNDYPVMTDYMSSLGYFTGIKNKISHSTPYHPYHWDACLDEIDNVKLHKKDPEGYYLSTRHGIGLSQSSGKPFFLVINISDPHKPFYGMNGKSKPKKDPYVPSLVFKTNEVPVPGFLPDHPDVRLEVAHYYSSVRRADDCMREILRALEESGEAGNTLLIFLSDHGMALPFAKTCLYHHSTHTPLIIRWPEKIQPNEIDSVHMVSAVDLVPTVLDILGIQAPEEMDGQSFWPLLQGEKQENRHYVYLEYNESSSASRNPMRGVRSKKYGYIFNPWADGQKKFTSATTNMLTYQAMQTLAENDTVVAKRLELFDYRVVEEFYDYENDPDALHNLVSEPAYQEIIKTFRNKMEEWMVRENDHALEAFRNRNNPTVMKAYIDRVQKEAKTRKRDPEMSRKNENNPLVWQVQPEMVYVDSLSTLRFPGISSGSSAVTRIADQLWQLSGIKSPGTLQIYDLNGCLVQVSSIQNNRLIDVSGLPPGFYIARICAGMQRKIMKLIK